MDDLNVPRAGEKTSSTPNPVPPFEATASAQGWEAQALTEFVAQRVRAVMEPARFVLLSI